MVACYSCFYSLCLGWEGVHALLLHLNISPIPLQREKRRTSLTCSSASGSAALASSVICSDGTVLSSSFFPDSEEVLAAGRKRVEVVVIDLACRRGRGVIWRGIARVMGRRTEMSLRWADILIWLFCGVDGMLRREGR